MLIPCHQSAIISALTYAIISRGRANLEFLALSDLREDKVLVDLLVLREDPESVDTRCMRMNIQ